MYNIYTSMTATNEEITKLTARTVVLKLIVVCEQLNLDVVCVENIKQ